jgi:hypothetical protein
MKIYKIRNKKTGLFSMGGGQTPYHSRLWSKQGKSWNTLNHVKLHLKGIWNIPGCKPQFPMDDWQIVEFTITESNVSTISDLFPDIDL